MSVFVLGWGRWDVWWPVCTHMAVGVCVVNRHEEGAVMQQLGYMHCCARHIQAQRSAAVNNTVGVGKGYASLVGVEC